MSIIKKYNAHLIKRGFNGNLEIHQPFKLGQIITFDRRSGFQSVGHINDPYIGLNFTPDEKMGTATADINFGSETGWELSTKFAGNAKLPNSKLEIENAGFSIDFTSSGSYLLKTQGTTIDYISNTAELGDKIIDLYLNNKWNRNWFVLTSLVEAKATSLIISNSAEGKIELLAKGNFTGLENDLINAEANLVAIWKKGIQTEIIGTSGSFFPLFKCNGIKVKRRKPVGTPFESLIDPMNLFTIEKLKSNNDFEIFFDEYLFNEELTD